MQRLNAQDAPDERLSDAEVQAVLQRLRAAEPEAAEDARPTVRDLAEAAGVDAERVATALAAVREERSRALSAAAEAQRRRRLRTVAIGLAAALAAAVALNVPIGGRDPFTVADVETRPVGPYAPGSDPSVQVDAALDYHPPTLWRRIVGPSVDAPFGGVALRSPAGEFSTFRRRDGGGFGLQVGPYYSLSGTRLHMGYAYPARAETAAATEIVQPLTIDGVRFDLRVPLR